LLYQLGGPQGLELRSSIPHGDTFTSIARRGSLLYVGTGRGTVRVFDISQAVPVERAELVLSSGPLPERVVNLDLSGDLLIGMVNSQIVAGRLRAGGLSVSPAFSFRDPVLCTLQIAVSGRYLYLLGVVDGYGRSGGVATYDLQAGSQPSLVGRWTSDCGTGYAFAVGGGRAFIDCTPDFGSNQRRRVQVVDLTDPAQPFLAGTMALETDGLAVVDGILYALLSGEPRLASYDLSQPGVPPRLGTLRGEPTGLPQAYDPATKTGFAYGFDSGGPGGGRRYGIVAIDLSDPRRMSLAGYYFSEPVHAVPQVVLAGRVYSVGDRLAIFELER
jgi:hypothetical protein